MSAPIPYTCPLIDEVISTIRDQIKSLNTAVNQLEQGDPESCRDHIDNALQGLKSMIPEEEGVFKKFFSDSHLVIEQIRQANSGLRSWGESMEEERDELEKERDILYEQNSSFEYQINSLTCDLQRANELIAELQNQIKP